MKICNLVIARYPARLLLFTAFLVLLVISIAYTQPPPNLTGTIAYWKNNVELHIVEPDGTNDHAIWTNPIQVSPFLSEYVAWSPDGQEIAFASGHETLCSVNGDDIYGIRPDGSGYRRITNAPDCAQLAGYPKGSVSIVVENQTADFNIFFLYVEGADSTINFTLTPGYYNTYTISGVSDFGPNVLQEIVIFNASHTWFSGLTVNVQAGQTVSPSVPFVIGTASLLLRTTAPVWKRDGTQLAHLVGGAVPFVIDENPPLLTSGIPLFPDGAVNASWYDWSPVSDDILYADALLTGIYHITPGSNSGTLLVDFDLNDYRGISWLPDGSGFVYSQFFYYPSHADLYVYYFASGSSTQITNWSTGFAVEPNVSPDGQYISFSYAENDTAPLEIWGISLDGSTSWQIASVGNFPAWGPDISTGINPEPLAQEVELEQNYPNPFNPSTHIQYTLQKTSLVNLEIYNLSGQIINTLISKQQIPGKYIVTWDGTDSSRRKVSSGTYFYILKTDNQIMAREMLFVE